MRSSLELLFYRGCLITKLSGSLFFDFGWYFEFRGGCLSLGISLGIREKNAFCVPLEYDLLLLNILYCKVFTRILRQKITKKKQPFQTASFSFGVSALAGIFAFDSANPASDR